MSEPAARIRLIAQRGPEQDAVSLEVTIGTPRLDDQDPGVWRCSVGLTPLYAAIQDARGGDSLQALCLAISLALDLLVDFQRKGGTLRYEGGDNVPLEAYCFGKALGERGPNALE